MVILFNFKSPAVALRPIPDTGVSVNTLEQTCGVSLCALSLSLFLLFSLSPFLSSLSTCDFAVDTSPVGRAYASTGATTESFRTSRSTLKRTATLPFQVFDDIFFIHTQSCSHIHIQSYISIYTLYVYVYIYILCLILTSLISLIYEHQ